VVVLAGEEECRALAGERRGKGVRFAVELGGQLRVRGFLDELEGGQEVVGAGLEAAPELDLGTEAIRLPEDLLGDALVVPEPGLGCLRL
jgi:hypothetical protein